MAAKGLRAGSGEGKYKNVSGKSSFALFLESCSSRSSKCKHHDMPKARNIFLFMVAADSSYILPHSYFSKPVLKKRCDEETMLRDKVSAKKHSLPHDLKTSCASRKLDCGKVKSHSRIPSASYCKCRRTVNEN